MGAVSRDGRSLFPVLAQAVFEYSLRAALDSVFTLGHGTHEQQADVGGNTGRETHPLGPPSAQGSGKLNARVESNPGKASL